MNFTFIQLNKLNEISQCRTKSNHMIHVFKKQIDGCLKFHNEKTEERRESMWRINNSEEAIANW